MIKVVTSAEMREMDRHTIEDLGVPGVVLMENAGVGTYRVIQKLLAEIPHPIVYIFCGKGNNGGDGFVIARHLWDDGARVTVLIVGEEKDIRGDALINFNIVKNFQIPYFFITAADQISSHFQEPPNLIVDALLGTGIQGAVHGLVREVIDFINETDYPVVAVDVPSGLNADSPQVPGSAIRADLTVTMALPKRCHLFYPARSYVGELYIADIGIPREVRNADNVRVQIVEKSDIRLPERPPDSHKYQCGKVGVLAGSPGYTGAATLTAQAALRIGAGLVIAAIPEALNPIMESKLTEVITRPYPTGKSDSLNNLSLKHLEDFLEWCDVLAIGPGLGRSEETQRSILQILKNFNKPAVIDADALFALANNPHVLDSPHSQWVLTPHHGEFFRFFPAVSREERSKIFIELAQEFSREKQATLLLKGSPSLVVAVEGQVYVNSTGNSGLASGGTGDVLTGMVAGLMAQGMDAVEASLTANFLHGLCADEVVEESSVYTLTAGDLVENFGLVIKKHFFSEEGPS
ncbi:MAG: NAD(P)H-hydrate dehydratase [Calditrichia bacterium]